MSSTTNTVIDDRITPFLYYNDYTSNSASGYKIITTNKSIINYNFNYYDSIPIDWRKYYNHNGNN